MTLTLTRREAARLAAAPALLAPALMAATPAAAADSLGARFRALAVETGFSGAVCVSDRGRTVLSAAAGLANMPHAVAASPVTKFWIASITKVFTSAMVLRLRDAGLVDLDAPASRYIAGYGRGEATKITVRQLLNHTSGLPNADANNDYDRAVREGLAAYSLPKPLEQLVTEFASGPPVRTPGSGFDYNNFDYIALSLLIEKVTGQPWRTAVEKQLLAPLGLKATGFMEQARIVPGLADGYFRLADEAPWINPLPVYPENWQGSGCMYSTAQDLATFADALFSGRLIGRDSLEQFLKPGLDDYGLGLWIRSMKVGERKLRVAERYGSIMGFNGILFRVLDEGLTVVVTGNTNAANVGDLAADLAKARLAARG